MLKQHHGIAQEYLALTAKKTLVRIDGVPHYYLQTKRFGMCWTFGNTELVYSKLGVS